MVTFLPFASLFVTTLYSSPIDKFTSSMDKECPLFSGNSSQVLGCSPGPSREVTEMFFYLRCSSLPLAPKKNIIV
jgi:hypothetical protein